MKKFVALVLCLVLALSLCATAFAALTSGTVYYYNYSDDSLGGAMGTAAYNEAKEPTATKVGNIAYYSCAGTCMTICEKKDAKYVLWNGTEYIHLKNLAVTEYNVNPGYSYAYKYSGMCGQFGGSGMDVASKVNPLGETEYYQIMAGYNGITTDTQQYMINGVIYRVVCKLTVPTGHTWQAATFTADNKPATVSCTKCGATGICVSQPDYVGAPVAKQGGHLAGYNSLVLITAAGSNTTAAAASTTTSAVSSAKTFDAGIAMYVGMSIMAVTGSAVVIGKKKEF